MLVHVQGEPVRRLARRSPITPSMAVALTALAVALGGTAFAAGGGFASSEDGLVQACVAKSDIVNSVTDPVLGAVGSAAASLLGTVTTSVTPKGTVLVVAPGAKCPANTEPQSLSSAPEPEHGSASSSKSVRVGAAKTQVASLLMPAGTHLLTATVDIVQNADTGADSVIKCVFVDAAGKTIADTTSTATIPARSEGARTTMPLTALLTLTEPTEVGLACKDTAAAAQGSGSARGGAECAGGRSEVARGIPQRESARGTDGLPGLPTPGRSEPDVPVVAGPLDVGKPRR